MELPELPKIASTKLRKPARPGLPAIGSEFSMAGGRQQEAEEFARAMGVAFATTKAQNKIQKAKARARSRQAENAAKRR